MRSLMRRTASVPVTVALATRSFHLSRVTHYALPPPPPLPTQRASNKATKSVLKSQKRLRAGKLPPPPPLPNTLAATPRPAPSTSATDPSGGGEASTTTAPPPFAWDSPQTVLSTLIESIPTFYVPIQSVAAILEDESVRASVTGRGRFQQLLRRFPFLFDVRVPDTAGAGYRAEVRLSADVDHPRRGAADDKFMMTDIGETTYFVAKPEHVLWSESIEQPTQQNVRLTPSRAPPAIRVRLEDRPAVLERLAALIPSSFTPIEALEDDVPEELLFDPYFDCQGGLSAILGKFPEDFQVVGETVRRRPPHLAPLALDELDLAHSPLPDVAALVQREVCDVAIPQWVNVTHLYEQLTPSQRRDLKAHGHRSLSGFLRAHGRSVAVSQDMLSVSMWVTPHAAPEPTSQESDSDASAADQMASAAHRDAGRRVCPPPPRRSARSPSEALAALESETEDAFLRDQRSS